MLDITSDICPMTYVRTRLALDRLQPGQVLSVRLRGEDPALNVPRSAVRQGHDVLSRHTEPDGAVRLLLRRGPDNHRVATSTLRSVSASEPSA